MIDDIVIVGPGLIEHSTGRTLKSKGLGSGSVLILDYGQGALMANVLPYDDDPLVGPENAFTELMAREELQDTDIKQYEIHINSGTESAYHNLRRRFIGHDLPLGVEIIGVGEGMECYHRECTYDPIAKQIHITEVAKPKTQLNPE